MAKYGRFTLIVTNTAGDALSGVSVEVRRQGATVNGTQTVTGSAAVTVDNPGATTSIDIVAQNTGTTTYQVSAVAATTITANWGAGNVTLNDDDRLTLTNSLVSLFADSNGNDAKTNPLTTGSTGIATAWLTGGFYDVLISGGTATTTLLQDLFIPAERFSSTEFDSASAIVEILDTTRTLSTAGGLLQVWRNNATDKILFGTDGSLTATGSGYYYGNLTASGIAAKNSISLPAGSVTTAMLASQAISAVYAGVGANASASVASATNTTRASVTWTPTSGNIGLLIFAESNYDYTVGAAGEFLQLRLLLSGAQKSIVTPAGNLSTAPGVCQGAIAWLDVNAQSTATVATAAVDDIRTPGSLGGTCEYRGDRGPARIFVVEFKR